MHSMQLHCCMQCTVLITWLDTAWQVCEGSAVWLLAPALHFITENATVWARNEAALRYLHIPWQARVRCTALISAVEDTCVAYQWSVTALGGVSQLVAACLSHSSGSQPALGHRLLHCIFPVLCGCRNIPCAQGCDHNVASNARCIHQSWQSPVLSYLWHRRHFSLLKIKHYPHLQKK